VGLFFSPVTTRGPIHLTENKFHFAATNTEFATSHASNTHIYNASLVTYIIYFHEEIRSQDSSVVYRWTTGWMMGVRVPVGTGNFSLHHRVQTGCGSHPASYPVGNRGSFLGGKASGE
jgi:hypothetical protein